MPPAKAKILELTAMDQLLDLLHEWGRCGCKTCVINPQLRMRKALGNMWCVSFDMPDERMVISGRSSEAACESAVKRIKGIK